MHRDWVSIKPRGHSDNLTADGRGYKTFPEICFPGYLLEVRLGAAHPASGSAELVVTWMNATGDRVDVIWQGIAERAHEFRDFAVFQEGM